METIVGVAINYKGAVYALGPPNRHNHLIRWLVERGNPTPIPGDQGFITSKGRFVDRLVAASIAVENGQIDNLNWPPKLYSEDLW